MKTLSYKNSIIFLIISLIIGFSFLILFLVCPLSVQYYSEAETTQCEASFVKYEIKDKDYLLTVGEFNCKLFIDSEYVIDKQIFDKLKSGDKIDFRILWNEKWLNDKNLEQMWVCSVKTEYGDIVTVDFINQLSDEHIEEVKLVSICIFSLFLACAGFCVYRLIRIRSLKNKSKSECK